MNKEDIARNVRKNLKMSGISKNHAYKLLHYDMSSFNLLWDGSEPWEIEELMLLAEYAQITIDQLIGR